MASILGYKIFGGTKEELLSKIVNSKTKVHIVSGNPEVLDNGLKDTELFNNFISDESIIIPDGIGVVIAAKAVGKPVKEKIAGIEVFEELIKYYENQKKGIYLLGAKEEVVTLACKNLKDKYKNLIISGYHHGYFDINNCNDIIGEVNKSKAEAIFVAMGAPRQEKFIVQYMNRLNCNVFMGVGGSFDIFAGNLKRAPKWMISLGLEWLYRVSKEPYRIKRLSVIPKFLLKVVKSNK